MKNKISPTVIGVFVLGAIVLAVAALIAFGSTDFLHKRERFLVYFRNESIQGLTQGSPVKFSGVPVGHVVRLHVAYDPATNRSAVAVLCEFTARNAVTDNTGRIVDLTDPAQLHRLVDRGLRAQLGVLGLATGLLYIDLSFADPKEYPAPPAPPGAEYPVIPQVRSTISELATNATETMDKIKQIDFEGLANDLRALLQVTRERLEGVDLKGLVAQWKRTGASFDRLANAPEILQSLRTLDQTLGDVRLAVNHLDRQVDRNGANVEATLLQAQAALRQFNDAAVTFRRFVAAQQGLGDNAAQALGRVAEAADSVQELADFLERNPNALISGKKVNP